jgi:hypothetical protein
MPAVQIPVENAAFHFFVDGALGDGIGLARFGDAADSLGSLRLNFGSLIDDDRFVFIAASTVGEVSFKGR